MRDTSERQRRVTARHQPGVWIITLDDASWAALMVALSVAIEHSDQDWAARWRRLRTALGTVEGEDERGHAGSRPATSTEHCMHDHGG